MILHAGTRSQRPVDAHAEATFDITSWDEQPCDEGDGAADDSSDASSSDDESVDGDADAEDAATGDTVTLDLTPPPGVDEWLATVDCEDGDTSRALPGGHRPAY
jgi:hypothetical protein